eukprot:3247841-Alexandrium_andersonii.AAC.1
MTLDQRDRSFEWAGCACRSLGSARTCANIHIAVLEGDRLHPADMQDLHAHLAPPARWRRQSR